MNLRIAKKIMKAVGTPDERRYNQYQIGKACDRYEKTRTSKETDRWWAESVSNPGMAAAIKKRFGPDSA